LDLKGASHEGASRKVKLIEFAPERALLDFADNRTKRRGQVGVQLTAAGGDGVRAKVTEHKADGVRCRSALSPAKAL
jgi:hypothetical protein